MLSYKEYENKVYNWLSSKNTQDATFTFSVRKKSAKGAEVKHFIGTEKSGYFATTFWHLPVSFPGSSSDCIALLFRHSVQGLNYTFELTHTMSPLDAQNTSALNLCKSLCAPLTLRPELQRESAADNKMFTIQTKPKRKNYQSVEEMIGDIELDLSHIIEVVDQKIAEEKLSNHEFIAHRITTDEFATMNKKLQQRLAKLENNDSNIKSTVKKYWLYSPGEQAFLWEDFHKLGIMALGWDNLGNLSQYATKNDIERKLQVLGETDKSKKNDATANYEFANVMQVGDIIIVKKGRRELLGYGVVASNHYYDDSSDEYHNSRKVEWKKKGNWATDHDLALKTLTDITQYKEPENTNFLNYYDRLLGTMEENSSSVMLNKVDQAYIAPLNQILYGPPGTGKTYHTVLEAAKIISAREITNYDEALKIFNDNLGSQIEFITFHQNYSYEDFIQGLRPDVENGSALTFHKKDGVFKRIAVRALENLKLAGKNTEEISKEVLFNTALENFKESILDTDDKYAINDAVFIFDMDQEAFRYTGANWENHSNGIRMKFSDLKEFYRNNVQSRKDIKSLTTISGLANQHATYYLLVYHAILKFLPSKVQQVAKIEKKNYVIIIDEINRANISRVFGELITLIEPDKRFGGKIPMSVTLPSGDPFMVPDNLYIIGTMNTADKSIALLDIALRRRFEFVPMYPQYEIEGQTIYYPDVLRALNEKICKLKTRDFQIGHSYFMENSNLEHIMNRKVIPLLLEYFMNDEKTVREIITVGNGTVDTECWPMKFIQN